MKVLITSDCYKPTINGVVTSIINLKEGLEALGVEVRILTLSNNKRTYREKDVYYLGSIDISRIYPDARLRTKSGRKEIRDILDWEPDLIHTQTEFSTYTLAKKIADKLSIPIIHTYHTVYEDYTHYFSASKRLGKRAVATLTKRIGKQVDMLFAPTKKTKDILDTYKVDCPIEIIPSGIRLDAFREGSIAFDSLEMRRRLKIKEAETILLSVSRVSKEKNIVELIENMKLLSLKKFVLLIVGDGPERENLQKIVIDQELEDVVRFTGMVAPDKIHAYYKLADVFVSASRSETQGLTYIEALASGTPILCREDDCLRGVLENGVNGYSFTSKEEYVENLHRILARDEYKNMKINAEKSTAHFSKEAFAKSVYEVYKNLIKNTREEQRNEENIAVDSRLLNLITMVLLALMAAMTLYGYQKGYFTSITDLQVLIASVGLWGPMIFVLSQVLQVVFPVIPGGLGCLAGVILFGPIDGFFYNYIGIVVGSLIVFGLSKRYGNALIIRLFPRSIANRYLKWTQRKDKFKKWFAIAIFLPVAPDDLLCYIAGTTKMKWKDYVAIIIFGKPLSIAAYSLGLTTLFRQVLTVNF